VLTPVVAPVPARQLQHEIASLPAHLRLIDAPACQVYWSPADRIPRVLREIGRLRELTYRAVGEGTGRAIDLDAFDDCYLHLFSWDPRARRIIGAYRLGQTDRLAGPDALYTRTLFRYDERLLQRLSPALELGRSFVDPDYQRNYNALLQLWKGIGRFVTEHPRYRMLFGPVSVSTRYSSRTHALLTAFLTQNHRDADLAPLVEALQPPSGPCATPLGVLPRTADDADRLIARLEPDGKGMPILLRQYLKLNARVLGFNVDPAFGDVLDALMVVDLTTVDRAILNRYMGRDAAAGFLRHHARRQAA
jgi:putative hemolysin